MVNILQYEWAYGYKEEKNGHQTVHILDENMLVCLQNHMQCWPRYGLTL